MPTRDPIPRARLAILATLVLLPLVVGVAAAPANGATVASDRPVAAAFTAAGVPFIFVNAARPVVLQRLALAHAFAHLVLGHGDVVDERVEWSRNVPPEAAANDFARNCWRRCAP